MFRVELGNPAKRFLKKCDKELFGRLISEIKSLSVDPFPHDVKRVIGRKEKFLEYGLGTIEYNMLFSMKIILF